MDMQKVKAFLHDKIEQLEELGEDFLNEVKELFERGTGEKVPGDEDGDGIPDNQQQELAPDASEAQDVQTPVDGSQALPNDPVSAAEPVEEREPASAPAPAASTTQINPVDAAEPVGDDREPQVGNQSAESVTGAQDILTEVPGAQIGRGVVPEATEGANITPNRAEPTIMPEEPNVEPKREGDSTESQVKQ